MPGEPWVAIERGVKDSTRRFEASGGNAMNDSILVVDDDPSAIQLMGRVLADLGTLRFATNGADAVRLVRESPPDLILLDAEMPGMSGFKVFDALKEVPELAEVPVIFVTSHAEIGFEITALEMGAADFISKPVNPPLMLARVRTHLRVKRLTDELRRSAATDALTGIANRRQFDEWLKREWVRARRHGYPLALLLIDIDHFKMFNDHYGHPKGDSCLRNVARVIENTARRTADFVARCGGEEFAVLLPHTPRRGAEYMATRMLEAIAGLGIPHDASPTTFHVTASIGIGVYDNSSACWMEGGADPSLRDEGVSRLTESELLLAADKALYAAKRGGRAQARLLDIADLDELHISTETTQNSRTLRGAA
jgi:diguanylate cyclase (GGDEF)-like protein